MNYTIMTANGDYASLDLTKSGNKYLVTCYVYGFGITYKAEFDNYDEAEAHYIAKCDISHVEPIVIEHDEFEMMANID